MDDFIKERNDAILSKNKDEIIKYCKKYEISIPTNEEIFWAGVHKCICNLFSTGTENVSEKDYNESVDWLERHGFTKEY